MRPLSPMYARCTKKVREVKGKSTPFSTKGHYFELQLHYLSALVFSTPHLLKQKNGSRPHIFRSSVCSFAHSSLTLRKSMSAKLRTLRRQVALAWILLLALLPQIVVKSLHYHDSVPTCSTLRTDAQAAAAICADCLREAAAQAVQQGRFATAPTAKWPEGIGEKASRCHHHNDSKGQDPASSHRNCSICHFVPSPCTAPTVTQFCFFVSTPETPFLFDSPSDYHTVTERAAMRGPPLV